MTSDLAVDALATHRLTRLVTQDTITRPLRARIIRTAYRRRRWRVVKRGGPGVAAFNGEHLTEAEWDQRPHDDDDAPKLAAFIVCPWCVGLWISFGVVVARRYAGVLWQPLARALALSTAAALIAGHEVEAS